MSQPTREAEMGIMKDEASAIFFNLLENDPEFKEEFGDIDFDEWFYEYYLPEL